MSIQANTDLFERAAEAIDRNPGTGLDDAIALAIKNNDLDHLAELVAQSDALDAQEDFYGYNLLP